METPNLTIFDSHAHYNDPRFFGSELPCGRDELLSDLFSEGNVQGIVNAGTNIETSRESLALAERFDGIYATVGIHPHDSEKAGDPANCIREMLQLLSHKKAVAIGEIGLDFHYDFSDRLIQLKWFELQMKLARETGYPVVIHDREAHGAVFDIIQKYPEVHGVIHSYSGSAESAQQLCKLGYYISFSGSVTFKNASAILSAVAAVPSDRILIETDCPYLAPVPNRGKINHSGNLIYTAQKIADIKGLSLRELCRISMENACSVFRIPTSSKTSF